MAEVATAFVSLLPSARRFGPQVDAQVSGPVSRSGRKAGGLFSGAFGKVASRLGPLVGAAVVGGFIKSSVDLEASFSRTMNQIQAATNIPAKGLKSLQGLAIQLGRDTTFSAKDAADAMLELAKNGIDPATIKAGALKSALTLAAAGGVDLETAADTMGNALNAFGLSGDKAASVASALAGAANASSASVESLSEGLSQSAAGAHQAGLSVQETTAALAAFANAGIKGSDAGTSLKTFLQRLVPTTSKAQSVMESYSLSTYDAANAQKQLKADDRFKGKLPTSFAPAAVSKAIGQMFIAEGDVQKGQKTKLAKMVKDYEYASGIIRSKFTDNAGNFKSLASISGTLGKALGGLSQAQKSVALTNLFGSDASRAAVVLAGQGTKGIQKYEKATNDQSAAQKQAAASMKGTAGAIEALKGSLETVQLQFGLFLAPTVVKGLKLFTRGLNALPSIVSKVGAALSGGGATAGASKLAGSLRATGAAVTAFLRPLVPIVQKYARQIVAVLGPGLSQIGALLTTQLLPAFRKLLPVLEPVAKFLLGMFGDAIVGLIKGFIQAVKGAINIVAGIFKLIVALVHGDWAGAWKAVIQIAKGALDLVIGAIKVYFNFGILAIFKRGIFRLLFSWRGLFKEIPKLAERGLKGAGELAEKGLAALGRLFVRGLKGFGKLILDGIKGYLSLWRALFRGLLDLLVLGFKVLRSRFGGALAAVRTIIAEAIRRYVGAWRELFTRFASAAKSGLSTVVDFFKGLGGRIFGYLKSIPARMFIAGARIVGGIIAGIKSEGAKLAKFIRKFILDTVPAPIAHVLGIHSPSRVMAAQARNIPLGIVSGIDAEAPSVDKAMRRVARRIDLDPPRLDPSVSGTTHTRGTNTGVAGPQFHVEKVEAQDVNHFLREMHARSRSVAGGGIAF